MLMQRLSWLVGLMCVASVSAVAQLSSEAIADQKEAMDRLSGVQPGVRFLGEGAGLERVYGAPFGGGSSAADAFSGFMAAYSMLFASGPSRFVYQGEQELMYGRFSTGTYQQFYGDYKVDRGQVTLLSRNQIGSPIVLAVNGAKPISGPIAPAKITGKTAQASLKKHHPSLKTFEEPALVIWVGEDRPHLAWTFIASSPTSPTGCTTCGSLPERVEAFVDAHTGQVLEERQAIWSIDVTGNVSGWATPGLKPDQANNPETLQPLHNINVNITGGNSAFTSPNGNFTITNGGSAAVTVNAPLTGRWARVVNQAGTTMSLSQTVTPPGPANFIFNLVQDEVSTAQVNGYIFTNLVHDFAKAQNPAYPGLDISMPVNVNVSGSCNAYYNGSSINFYRAATSGTPCPNMAYSTVVWHEYGHHIVSAGGTNQGAYGEGMGDTVSNLLGDTPWTGEDFRGQNTGPLRNAINTITYPSAAEIHTAGQIVSGAFWETVIRLDSTIGHSAGLALMRSLAINSVLLHPPAVSPGMTVDVLTLDDNDADISNGTPHYNEIAAGFGAKRLFAPPVEWVKFTPISVPPDFKNYDTFDRPINILMKIQANSGVPNPATVRAFHRFNGSSWRETGMIPKGLERYLAIHKRPLSGTQVDWYLECADTQGRITRYPLTAPAIPASYLVANDLITVAEDFGNSLAGWTVSNDASLTSGAWVAGNPNGTNLNGLMANPEDDSNDTGTSCFFTGQAAAGGGPGDADVDGGPTTLTSPAYTLSGNDAIIEYDRWFFNDDFDADALVVEVSTDGGTTWRNVETVVGIENTWVHRKFRLGSVAPLGSTVRIRFTVSDSPNNSVTEAAIDHLIVRRIVP